jgi:hypothetical protein
MHDLCLNLRSVNYAAVDIEKPNLSTSYNCREQSLHQWRENVLHVSNFLPPICHHIDDTHSCLRTYQLQRYSRNHGFLRLIKDPEMGNTIQMVERYNCRHSCCYQYVLAKGVCEMTKVIQETIGVCRFCPFQNISAHNSHNMAIWSPRDQIQSFKININMATLFDNVHN